MQPEKDTTSRDPPQTTGKPRRRADTGTILAVIGLVIAAVACLAAVAVVPEVRRWFGLDPPTSTPIASAVQATPAPTDTGPLPTEAVPTATEAVPTPAASATRAVTQAAATAAVEPTLTQTEPTPTGSTPAVVCVAVTQVPMDEIGGEILDVSRTGQILRILLEVNNAGDATPTLTWLVNWGQLVDEATGQSLGWLRGSARSIPVTNDEKYQAWMEYEIPSGMALECVKLILANGTIFEHIPVPP